MFVLEKHDPILITGGSGFVGSHLIEYLSNLGYTDIHATSTRQKDIPSAFVHVIDLTDASATTSLFQTIQPKVVFHLASLAEVGNSFENQSDVYRNNSTIQLNVLEATRLITPQARIISITSAQVYGKSNHPSEIPITEGHEFRPVNPYAVSKVHQDVLASMYCTVYDLDIIRVRPFNHIGERQSDQFVISSLAKQVVLIENGSQAELLVGNTDSIRDFTDVKDVVNAYYMLMQHGVAGEAYNVGSGQGVSITQIINLFTELAKKEIIIKVDEARLRPSDIPAMIADTKKISQLGWQPKISLESTIRRILDYWRELL